MSRHLGESELLERSKSADRFKAGRAFEAREKVLGKMPTAESAEADEHLRLRDALSGLVISLNNLTKKERSRITALQHEVDDLESQFAANSLIIQQGEEREDFLTTRLMERATEDEYYQCTIEEHRKTVAEGVDDFRGKAELVRQASSNAVSSANRVGGSFI